MRAGVAMVVLAGLLLVPVGAHARKQSEVRYRYDQVWGATIRLIRVDYKFKIRDRDEEVGYLLFDYEDGGRAHPGSVELVRYEAEGEERIRIVLTIPAMPSYVERMVLDKLGKKLEKDYGMPPPPRPKKKPAPEEPERDEDDGEGKGQDEGKADGDSR
jgi:hypothetical protein